MAAAVAIAATAEAFGFSPAMFGFGGGAAAGGAGAAAGGVAGTVATGIAAGAVAGAILVVPSSAFRGREADYIQNNVTPIVKTIGDVIADPKLRGNARLQQTLARFTKPQAEILELTKQIDAGKAADANFLNAPEGVKLNADRGAAWGAIAQKIADMPQEDQFLLQQHLKDGITAANYAAEAASKPKVEFKSWDAPAGAPAAKAVAPAPPAAASAQAAPVTVHVEAPPVETPVPTNVAPRNVAPAAPTAPVQVAIPSGASAGGLADPATLGAGAPVAGAAPTITVPRPAEGDVLTAPHAAPFEAPVVPQASEATPTAAPRVEAPPVESPVPTNIAPRTATPSNTSLGRVSGTSPREHGDAPPAAAPTAPLKVAIPSGGSSAGLADPATIRPMAPPAPASAGPNVTVPRTAEGDALTKPVQVNIEAPEIPAEEAPAVPHVDATATTPAKPAPAKTLPLMVPDAPPDDAQTSPDGAITAGTHGTTATFAAPPTAVARPAPPPAATVPSSANVVRPAVVSPNEHDNTIVTMPTTTAPVAAAPVVAGAATVARDNAGTGSQARGKTGSPPLVPPADAAVPKTGAHAGADAGAVPQTHDLPQVATKPPQSNPQQQPPNVPNGDVPLSGANGSRPDSIHFGFDKSDLDAEAVAAIKQEAADIKKHGFEKGQHVRIEGDTDAVGTDRYNVALSRRRAESVAARLKTELHNQGIDVADKDIDIVAAGKSHRVEATDGESRANRRAEISVTKPPSPVRSNPVA